MSPFIGPIRVVTKVQLHYINQYGRTTGNVIFTFLLWVEEFVHFEIVSLPVAVDVVPERRKHVTDQKKSGKSVPPIADKVLLAENCSVRTKKPSLPSIQLTHVENLRVFVRLKMRSKSIFNLTSSFLIHVNAGKIWLAWQRDNDRVLD